MTVTHKNPADAQIKKESAENWCQTLIVKPGLRISVRGFNSVCKACGKDKSDIQTSGDFFDMVFAKDAAQLSNFTGVRPELAKQVMTFKVSYRNAKHAYDAHIKQVNEANGKERHYKDATKDVRDEIAGQVLSGLYAHHGLAADTMKLVKEAYAAADLALEVR